MTDSVDCVTQYDTFPPYLDHLNGLEPPFILLDSDPSAHLPFSYDALPMDEGEAEDVIGKALPARELPREHRGDFPTRAYQAFVDGNIAQQRADYERGAELAVERFKWRLELLDHFDLLENTLVIFTADHGEELGEYGLIGHGFSPVPETIYVPLLFYVPNGSVTVHGDCAALVDLLPTIGSLLGHDTPDDLPGYDLTEGSPDDRMVFAANMRRTGGGDSYMNYSAWSKDSGYSYTESGLRSRLRVAGYRLLKSPARRSHRKRPFRVLRNEIGGRQGRFGNPDFGDDAARRFCERIRSGSEVSRTQELSEEVKHRLRSLGYTEDQI